MKRILKSIVVIILCGALFSAALLVPLQESETVDPQILEEADAAFLRCGIYLDGKLLYNWKLSYPVVSIDGKAYLPVDLSALSTTEETDRVGVLDSGGISAESAAVVLLSAPKAQETEEISNTETATLAMVQPRLKNRKSTDHSFKGFKVTTGFKDYNGLMLSSTRDIAVTGSGVYYASEDFYRNELGIDVFYDPGKGVYLSTDPDVSAADWAAVDTNAGFVEGLTRYIMGVNKYLSRSTAEWYAFLIIHTASQNSYITPNMLFAVIYTESHFFANAGTNALGLMQILYKYARLGGVTKEMLLDPHTNMELGASQLNYLFKTFNGDQVKAFAAYNMGAGAVRGNPDFKKGYANTIISWMNKLEKWLKANDFSTVYKEQLTLKKTGGN